MCRKFFMCKHLCMFQTKIIFKCMGNLVTLFLFSTDFQKEVGSQFNGYVCYHNFRLSDPILMILFLYVKSVTIVIDFFKYSCLLWLCFSVLSHTAGHKSHNKAWKSHTKRKIKAGQEKIFEEEAFCTKVQTRLKLWSKRSKSWWAYQHDGFKTSMCFEIGRITKNKGRNKKYWRDNDRVTWQLYLHNL